MAHHSAEKAAITKEWWDVINVDGDEHMVSLLNPQSNETKQVRLEYDNAIADELEERFNNDEALQVELMTCLSQSKVIGLRANNELDEQA